MRLFMPIVVAAFVAGCGERAVMPTSPLTPGAASRDAGTPPPPPIAGDGEADFEAFSSFDGSSAADCSASASFGFSYQYFVNKTNNNAFLHITINGQSFDVHQTKKKLDTNGSISGPGFTFTVDNTTGGSLTGEGGGTVDHVALNFTGTLTTGEGGSCTASATLTADLHPHEGDGN